MEDKKQAARLRNDPPQEDLLQCLEDGKTLHAIFDRNGLPGVLSVAISWLAKGEGLFGDDMDYRREVKRRERILRHAYKLITQGGEPR